MREEICAGDYNGIVGSPKEEPARMQRVFLLDYLPVEVRGEKKIRTVQQRISVPQSFW